MAQTFQFIKRCLSHLQPFSISSLRRTPVQLQLVCITVLSIVIQTSVVLTIPNLYITSDTLEYYSCAQSIANEGQFYYQDQPESFRTPGYPLLLAILKALSVDSFRSIAWVQCMISSIEIAMIFWLTQKICNTKTAWTAALILMLNPGEWYNSISILTETLFSFFLTAILCIAALPFQSKLKFFHLGLMCGYAALIRPIAVFLFIPLLIWLISANRKHAWFSAGFIFLVAIGILQGGWIVRNYIHHGKLYFTEINALNLYAFWGQAIVANETGEDYDHCLELAIDEWNFARHTFTPPEMMDHFYTKAWAILQEKEWSIVQIMIYGAYRQIVESGWTRLTAIYNPENDYHLSVILHEIMEPNDWFRWTHFIFVLFVRMFETGFILFLYFAAVLNILWLFRNNKFNQEQKKIVWLAAILFGYMFVLSSGPAAGIRFREQYFPIVVILAMPIAEIVLQYFIPRKEIKKTV